MCDLTALDAVFAPEGALEAFVRAKDEGSVNWVGVTGHTEQAPVVHAEALRRHLRERLDPRDRSILAFRYGLTGARPLTQRETAARLGISRSYVSRLESRALKKLREAFAEADGEAPAP